MFVNAEIARKAFSPAIVDELAAGKPADRRTISKLIASRADPL